MDDMTKTYDICVPQVGIPDGVIETAMSVVGKVNHVSWEEGDPRTWLCLSCLLADARKSIAGLKKISTAFDRPPNHLARKQIIVTRDGYFQSGLIEVLSLVKRSAWRIEFYFQHKPQTWDSVVVFVDPMSGKVPEKLESESCRQVKYYESMDFLKFLEYNGKEVINDSATNPNN